MKNLKKLLLISSLAVLGEQVALAQTQPHWTDAHPNLSTCANARSRVDCTINLTYKLANNLFPYVSYEVYGSTFLPILHAAALASDTLNDLGPWALETRVAVENLVVTLESKERQIDSLLSTPAHFDLARQLKSSIRIIKRELN
jgi:hypothetical protein